jgi:Fumarylacetoacetase N-terminal
MTAIDIPHDSGFGIDNLPYGVFSTPTGPPRVGVRIGDAVIDLAVALDDDTFAHGSLNPFMAQGRDRWIAVRDRLADMITTNSVTADAIRHIGTVTMHLRSRSPTMSTSTPPNTTPAIWAGCFGPIPSRCCPTGNTSRSAVTAEPAP